MPNVNFMFVADSRAEMITGLVRLGWLIDSGPKPADWPAEDAWQRYKPHRLVNIDLIDEGFVQAHEWRDETGNIIQPAVIDGRFHCNVRVTGALGTAQIEGREQFQPDGDLRSIFVRTALGAAYKDRLDRGHPTTSVVAYVEQDVTITQDMIDRYNALPPEKKRRLLRTKQKITPGIKSDGVTLLEDSPAFGGVATPRRVWA